MIYINKVFKRLVPNDTYVLMDFDRTLTTHESTVSWGVIEDSPLVHPKLKEETGDLYKYYREIEIDPNIDPEAKFKHMEDWVEKAVKIYNKYVLNEETILRTLKDHNTVSLRSDSKYFLERMKQLKIPVIITSAGAGTVITDFLENENCMHDNITVLSNFLTFKKGIVSGIKPPIIHSLNKDKIDYGEIIGDRSSGILFGDQIEDIKTAQGRKTTNVGFCDRNTFNLSSYNSAFDITLTGNSSFDNVGKILIKGYK